MESDSDANNNAEHSVDLLLQQERTRGQDDANIRAGDVPPKDRHCQTCTCKQHASSSTGPSSAPRTHLETAHDPTAPLPPPLPLPLYSVRRRLLSKLYTTALQSTQGQQRLVDTLLQNTAQAYIALTQHFMNQSEPAYCGITTACMVLNALECDTVWRWKGGWRYFANEDVLLAHCRGCWSRERLQRSGITVHEFQRLVACHGLHVTLRRPYPIIPVPVISDDSPHHHHNNNDTNNHNNNNDEETYHTLDEFRADVQTILSGGGAADAVTQRHRGILVVSFSRAGLGQTGEGHFSPVAAYHAHTDSVLILDVARYKYPPYWVSVTQLYHAMQPCDPATNQPRGWLLVHDHHHPIHHNHKSTGSQNNNDGNEGDDDEEEEDGPTQAGLGENRRPAHLVPVAGRDPHPCPMHPVQVRYCPNREKPIP